MKDGTEPTYQELLDQVKLQVDRQMRELKNVIWNLYNIDGISPLALRKAFEEIMVKIEKEENEYNERWSLYEKTNDHH